MRPYRNNSVKKMKRKRKSKRNKKPRRLGTGGGAKGKWVTTG